MPHLLLMPLLLVLAALAIGPAWADDTSTQEQTGNDDDSAQGDDDDSARDEDDEPEESPGQEQRQRARERPMLIVEEEIVVTATGQERVLADSPIPVLLLRDQDLREHGASDLGEALRRAPGLALDVSDYSDQFGGSGLSLSGAEARHTLVLIDGRPMAGDSAGVVDLSQIPADLIERVEIVEGPMSALYGSDAIGGVLNIITRRAAKGAHIGGHSNYGSFHNQTHGLQMSAGTGEIGGRLGVSYQYFDGAPDPRWLAWQPGRD